MNALAALVRFIDRVNDVIGRGVAWLTLAMVLLTFSVVVLRYGFALGWVWLQESYVWLHGVVFMVGASYTLLHNGHVRVDIFYRPASARYKAVVDLCGALFLLLPLLVLIAFVGYPYVAASWDNWEASREAGGLEGLYLLKTVILVFCALLTAQAVSMVVRSILFLRGREEFAPVAGEEGHVE